MKSMMTVLLGMTLCVNALFGQDVITKINGGEIKAKVIEMNADVIKYKGYNSSSDSVYTISKNEVFMIKYENGSKTIVYQEKVDNSSDLPLHKIEIVGRKFMYNNLTLKGKELKEVLAQPNDLVINGYLRKARSKEIAGLVLVIVGGVAAGGLVGIGVLIVGACIMNANKQYQYAVIRYNEIIDQRLQKNNPSTSPVSNITK